MDADAVFRVRTRQKDAFDRHVVEQARAVRMFRYVSGRPKRLVHLLSRETVILNCYRRPVRLIMSLMHPIYER